jgi:tRNA/tmRNA/rRNA uracil-C5-methylase (TrmA/RlmC/RlmD family)
MTGGMKSVPKTAVRATIELVTGAVAAGGGCVARAADGRVVFVRHSLPGERVVAEVTAETTSYLRADAVEVLEASPERVAPPCPHAGPGRCGGCDWQHVALPTQRELKSDLVVEQLRRVAGIERTVRVEEVPGAPDGLGWRTRVTFSVDRGGRIGLRRHRSHDIEHVAHCPLGTAAVDAVAVGASTWRGARQVEVVASPDGGEPVVTATGRNGLSVPAGVRAGLVVNGRTVRRPDRVRVDVLGERFEVSSGVFWQVHPAAAATLTTCVLDGLAPRPGERVADLYAGAGLFTVSLARAVGPRGSVVAVERSATACADAVRNAGDLHHIDILRSPVDPDTVAERLGSPDLVVLDPARQGAGQAVMGALVSLVPAPRRMAYVSCDPASFARDLRVALDAGWSMDSLRAFDLFPMTEHVESVAILVPPAVRKSS